MLVQVYMDDIIFGSTKRSWCDEFEALMKSIFQMSSMGELIFFLGLQVKQKEDGIFISQDKYVVEILKKFNFASVKTASTPIETQKSLTKDEEAADVDVHLYRSMIGSLMYLTASRPDIMFAVCACSRFQVTPKTSHLNAVKRIFRYLKGKPKLGLWYPRVSSFDLEAYSDSDYAGANLDRKSTTGGCQFLGRRLISWQCKKQTIVATSTTEAEYVAAANCYGQVLWIQNQMLDYGFNFMNTKIYIDNESTICIVKNPVFHSKTKHIEIRHHFIRDAYEKKLIQVLKIHTDDNVADLLTKAFDVSRAVVISESSVRNDLLFDDDDGITCLTNDEIFENLALIGKGVKFLGKVTPLFDSMLVPHQAPKGEGSEQPSEPQPIPSPTYPSTGDQPPVTDSSSSYDTTQDSRDSLEDTNGSEGTQVQVLALETSKDAQAAEILKLKDQIKKLKRKCKPSISHHKAWLKSVKRLSMKKRLGRKESVSKQGRKNAKPEPTLDAFDELDVDGRDYMETEDVIKEWRQSNETKELNKGSGEKGGSTEELVSTAIPKIVSTARPELSTARPDVDAARQEDSAVEPRTPPTTTSIFDDEDITMAQTLIKMKEEKAKEKGVSIKDIEDSPRLARSILTLKPLPINDPKEKGKSVLEEPEPTKKMTRKRERQREEEASKAAIAETYDEVQAGIDADALFAAKLQQEEREEYTIEERAKFLAEIINMGGYKHSQLKAKTFVEIQGLYEKQKRVINDFKPMDSDDAVKDFKEAAGVHKQKVLEEPNSTKVEVKQERHEKSIRKRPCKRLKMKATKKSKRQKTDADLEEEEQLKAYLKIVLDEEGIIDYEVLEKRFPIIIWESKFYDFDRHGAECIYYTIFRSDGSSRWINTFSEMVTRVDRLDLVELYNMMMKRFETTTPEGVDLVLWGDLKTMFNANAEDELWQNQERWNLKSWNLYENCGVHTLILEDGTEIHMLAERKYPLTKEILERMLSLRLVAGTASKDAYTLLRFIQKKINEYGSHDGCEKDLLVLVLSPHNKWSSVHHV
ncbi:putative ribonuclease H-like domain-containing protein [Tanacetum coccineum]|uniref:Ribonuclease H-like domain-containing protein n=1 Tax=Tanacetum coccineum TaxID=301880 RepID=A0ABQ5C109_9ASTR